MRTQPPRDKYAGQKPGNPEVAKAQAKGNLQGAQRTFDKLAAELRVNGIEALLRTCYGASLDSESKSIFLEALNDHVTSPHHDRHHDDDVRRHTRPHRATTGSPTKEQAA